MLKGFKAVPPLVTDIDLSMDDRFLYVSCWGTGDLQQYDVSDPFKPKLTGKVRIGGIVSRATHPGAKNGALNGGPQMVEISRDGRRVYFTNSLYGAIDPQFYPDGIDGWMVKLDAKPGRRHRLRSEILRRLAEGIGRIRSARRRRLLVRLLLLSVSWPPDRRSAAERGWPPTVALAGPRRARLLPRHQPGHGLAVRRRARTAPRSFRTVLLSLVPIALGHATAIALVLVAALALGLVFDHVIAGRAAAVILIGWALWHAVRGHRQRLRVGMQTGLVGLAVWSCLSRPHMALASC